MEQKSLDYVEDLVRDEIVRAVQKFPTWPTDPLHALAVLGEEFGELTKAVLQSVYEPHKVEPLAVEEEAIQTAAMALRFVASLRAYRYSRSEQHHQFGMKPAPSSIDRRSAFNIAQTVYQDVCPIDEHATSTHRLFLYAQQVEDWVRMNAGLPPLDRGAKK